MDGNDAGDKYITPPEDVLKPLDAPKTSFVEAEEARVRKTLRILEDQNGGLYINPDAQHIGEVRSSTDILRIYSREIQALREVVSLLMSIHEGYLPIVSPRPDSHANKHNYDKVNKYLQNASWELSLVNDPKNPGSSPG